MSRAGATTATLLLGLFVASGCGEDASDPTWVDRLPPSTPVAFSAEATPPVRAGFVGESGPERLVRRAPHEAVPPALEIRRSRAGTREVVSDARRGWALEAGEHALEGELLPGARLRIHFAAETAARARLLVRNGAVQDAAIDRELAAGKSAGTKSADWHPLVATLPDDLGPDAQVLLDLDAPAWVAQPWMESGAEAGPLVVLVSIDTLRPDHLGCYGYARDTSPRIDSIARDGFLFERAMSSSPWTLPAYGSLLTGLLPTEHRAGVAARAAQWFGEPEPEGNAGRERVRDDALTLAEALSANGYRTAAFYANPFLDPASGLDAGFDRYVRFRYNAAAGVDLALEWLDEVGPAPGFLFLQLTDPHWPYAPPPPWEEKFGAPRLEQLRSYPPGLRRVREDGAEEDLRRLLIDLYDAEVAYMDSELGRLFDALDGEEARARTILLIHSDHGEEFWEHDGFEHGHSLYDELLHVPLILRLPSGGPAPRRIANQVRALDVLPTLLDLLRIPTPALHGTRLHGTSLQPLLARDDVRANLVGFAESLLYAPPLSASAEAKCLIEDGYKLIVPAEEGSAPRLYRIGEGEATDLAASMPERAARMEERLREAMRAHRSAGAATELQLGPDEVRALDGLGYAGFEDD